MILNVKMAPQCCFNSSKSGLRSPLGVIFVFRENFFPNIPLTFYFMEMKQASMPSGTYKQ